LILFQEEVILVQTRMGGQGSDDIYVFLENKKLKCTQELDGNITDVITGHVLPETKVNLYENGVEKSTMISDAAGFYTFSCRMRQNLFGES
jgi:hypothetical protein